MRRAAGRLGPHQDAEVDVPRSDWAVDFERGPFRRIIQVIVDVKLAQIVTVVAGGLITCPVRVTISVLIVVVIVEVQPGDDVAAQEPLGVVIAGIRTRGQAGCRVSVEGGCGAGGGEAVGQGGVKLLGRPKVLFEPLAGLGILIILDRGGGLFGEWGRLARRGLARMRPALPRRLGGGSG